MQTRISTRIGQRLEILEAYKNLYGKRQIRLLCSYNSAIDMLIQEKDQDLMMIPIDDRMANRAHGAAEAANIRNYRFSDLDIHLQRLQTSAELLQIKVPMSTEELKGKLHDLAFLAYQTLQQENFPNIKSQVLVLRLLLSSGSGDFGIYSAGKTPVVYAMVYLFNMPLEKLVMGVQEYTLKELWTDSDYLSNAKTVNYLENSIMADYSKKNGGYIGIKLDKEGHVLEGAIANIAFVLNDGTFAYPPMHKTIRGTTLRDSIEIVKRDLIPNLLVTSIKEVDLLIQDVHTQCKEAFFLQNEKIIPIVQLDGKMIGDGTVGLVSKHLQSSFKEIQQTGGELIRGIQQNRLLNCN